MTVAFAPLPVISILGEIVFRTTCSGAGGRPVEEK
jgi:hypothetical protein